MESKEIVNRYIVVTRNIIKMLSEDEDIDKLMMRRQKLLEQLSACNLPKEELKSLIILSGMQAADLELEKKLKSEMNNVKEEIRRINNHQKANVGYGIKAGTRGIFSKSI